MLAEELDYVLGLDTHRDEHVVAVVTAPAGAVVAGARSAADARGYRALLRVADRYAQGRRAWAIEGSGSYGAGLTRYLAARGETVLEISRTPRTERRLRGKDDAIDAATTARSALASERLALPRAGERREALRLLLVARRSAVDVRREALSQLRAVIVTAPDPLRHELRGLSLGKLLDRCGRLRRSSAAPDQLATRLVLRSLARRVRAATLEADEFERELLGHVRALAPALLNEAGVGPLVAAQLLVAWSHHGRLRSEACVTPAQPRRRPPTQPRAAHDRATPPDTRRNDPRLHRPPHRRRQEHPPGHTAAQALPRPSPLPTTRTTASKELTSHRSITPAHPRSRARSSCRGSAWWSRRVQARAWVAVVLRTSP